MLVADRPSLAGNLYWFPQVIFPVFVNEGYFPCLLVVDGFVGFQIFHDCQFGSRAIGRPPEVAGDCIRRKHRRRALRQNRPVGKATSYVS